MAISTPTVLVLGAGASKPYGFPLGIELRDVLCAEGANPVRRLVLQGASSIGELERFIDELKHSGHTSVDVFLEHNPEFMSIGKLAMAAYLVPCEDAARLFPPRVPSPHHWYEYLVNLMEVGTTEWERNRLSVITYNYDRSFEHYFATVISRRARVSLSQARRMLFARVKIVHVHGALGEYAVTRRGRGVPYDCEKTDQDIMAAADAIRVVSEADDGGAAFDQAEQSLRRARRVYFLGFGFNRLNVQRLRVFSDVDWLNSIEFVSGTRRGIPDRDWELIRDHTFGSHWLDLDNRQTTVADFLARNALLS